MKFSILTYDNKVGIVSDAFLLKKIIDDIGYDSNIIFIDRHNPTSSDVGIWIQNFDIELLNCYSKNIFFINEEWAGSHELNNLNLFDFVVCKSKFAYDIIKTMCNNAVHLSFISTDFYDQSVSNSNLFLHFMGRSIQKNTELILQQTLPITLIDSYNRFSNLPPNFNHINTYQNTNQLKHLLNCHGIHICCSLYESWGHYLFEGLSTGSEIICSDIPVFKEQLDWDLVHFIPTKELVDFNYVYCADNKNNTFSLRKSFFVDESFLRDKIENFVPIGKSILRRKLFTNIIEKGKKNLSVFFNSL